MSPGWGSRRWRIGRMTVRHNFDFDFDLNVGDVLSSLITNWTTTVQHRLTENTTNFTIINDVVLMISEYETIYHRPDLFSAYNLYRISVTNSLRSSQLVSGSVHSRHFMAYQVLWRIHKDPTLVALRKQMKSCPHYHILFFKVIFIFCSPLSLLLVGGIFPFNAENKIMDTFLIPATHSTYCDLFGLRHW
jgi:hypothetical protein